MCGPAGPERDFNDSNIVPKQTPAEPVKTRETCLPLANDGESPVYPR